MRTDPDQQSFREWLLQIGNGLSSVDGAKLCRSALVLPDNEMNSESIDELIDYCFPPALFTDPINNANIIAEAGILCPTNVDVHRINDTALARMTGTALTYASIDEPLDSGELFAANRYDFNIDAVNNECPTGVPPHLLHLKVCFFPYFFCF